jgi:hypothetical protein
VNREQFVHDDQVVKGVRPPTALSVQRRALHCSATLYLSEIHSTTLLGLGLAVAVNFESCNIRLRPGFTPADVAACTCQAILSNLRWLQASVIAAIAAVADKATLFHVNWDFESTMQSWR